MRTSVRVWLFVGSCLCSLALSISLGWAGPTFLNRQAYPLPLALHEIGPFHNNHLRTFEVLTQWSNDNSEDAKVYISFTFYDSDSGGTRAGEDGEDDVLMTVKETFTLPGQVSNWGKSFILTTIGGKLNRGFDHPQEGAGLELFVDVQVTAIKYLPPSQ